MLARAIGNLLFACCRVIFYCFALTSLMLKHVVNRSLIAHPIKRTIINTPIRRPIPTKARAILERVMATYDDVLFPGGDLDRPITISAANRYIRRIRDGLPIEDWRTHDFRRSLSTGASELGVMPHVVEKMLGHELGGVLAVYNKHDWLKDQLEGYELYAEKLDSYFPD
ncbi:tyrosine-type recombinase/integrase [Photobacterium carnosum]|uniref:tyrosine-type recombinase/integrase n=1 Tax=Photobacterium carnosum TaxID=2023717 RepID=UPI002FCCDA18